MATINGTNGSDTISPGFVSPGVTGGLPGDGPDSIDGLDGPDAVEGAGGDDVILGSGGADSLTGADDNDVLNGGPDDDILVGDAGDDTLDGGFDVFSGADILVGGTGNDLYRIGPGDVVVDSGGRDTIESQTDVFVLPAGIEDLVLVGFGATIGAGNALANSITGGRSAEVLSGLDGADTILGGAGSDLIIGGAGDDVIDGGTDYSGDNMQGGTGDDRYMVDSAQDRIRELPAEGNDTVTASVSFVLPVGVEDLILAGLLDLAGAGNAAANRITGNAGANLLSGDDGADTLSGGNGNDTLIGGAGADLLIGGKGRDVFRYLAPIGPPDTIKGYSGRQDGIEVSAAGFGSDLVAGMTMAGEGRFIVNATGAPDGFLAQFILNTSTGLLRWDADGVNDTSAVDVAFLPGAKGLTGAEILVIA